MVRMGRKNLPQARIWHLPRGQLVIAASKGVSFYRLERESRARRPDVRLLIALRPRLWTYRRQGLQLRRRPISTRPRNPICTLERGIPEPGGSRRLRLSCRAFGRLVDTMIHRTEDHRLPSRLDFRELLVGLFSRCWKSRDLTAVVVDMNG